MRENKYRIVDATTKDCMVVPIYDDGGGRLEDRSLYADQGGVSISVGKAIGFDINIVGAQIIKRIGDDVVAYECYLGTPSDYDIYGTPTEVRVGRFKYKAGDFSSYCTPRITKRKLVVFSEREELAAACFNALNPLYGSDDYNFCGIEHSTTNKKLVR